MFNRILLTQEQVDLLFVLVEAARGVPRDRRQMFYYGHVVSKDPRALIRHEGLPAGEARAHFGDIEVLARENLVMLKRESRYDGSFDILPAGFKYYELAKKDMGEPLDRVQKTVRNFLSSEVFAGSYPAVYQKWVAAESKLWASDSEDQLTTIGHLCREAMQEFATALIVRYCPSDYPQEKIKTVARMQAVLQMKSSQLGKDNKQFLDALLAYWGAINDLIQRQEHSGQKEGKPLNWEDARRVVFQTAIVFFEVAKFLSEIDKG